MTRSKFLASLLTAPLVAFGKQEPNERYFYRKLVKNETRFLNCEHRVEYLWGKLLKGTETKPELMLVDEIWVALPTNPNNPVKQHKFISPIPIRPLKDYWRVYPRFEDPGADLDVHFIFNWQWKELNKEAKEKLESYAH